MPNRWPTPIEPRAAPLRAPASEPPALQAGLSPGRLLALGLACVLLLTVLGATRAGEAPTALADFHRDLWTTREGLPHNSINAIAQTRDGYLWLATWEGPVRFNGREFTVFDRADQIGLPDLGVHALLAEPDGALRVGGFRGGLSRHFERRWQGLEPAAGMIVALYRDYDAALWVGGEGLLRIAADGTRKRYEAEDGFPGGQPWAFREDGDGRLWIGGSFGLLYLESGRLRPSAADSGLPTAGVTQLLPGSDGRMLVGTERGVYRQTAEDRFESLSALLPQVSVTRMLADADGTLWIGTRNDGLYRLGALGLEHLGVEQGLPDSRVRSLLRDREGSLWVGTNAGLIRLRDAPMLSWTRARGLSGDFVRAVLPDGDRALWIGTSEGLNRLDADGMHPVGVGTELENESILSLAPAPDGSLWVGTFTRGAWRWDGERIVERIDREQGLPSNEVRAIVAAADGSLWLGTLLGLARVHAGVIELLRPAEGLTADPVYGLMQDGDGRLWIATMSGVARWFAGRLETIALPFSGAAYGFWQDPDRGDVWMTSDHGLLRWRRDDRSIQSIGREAGLPFTKLFTIVADRAGNFWLSGNRGVLRISRAEAEAVADGRRQRLLVDRFGEADGMASSQANGSSMPAAALSADGTVWFATSRGVSAVHPARLERFTERPPPVVIERIHVDGVELAVEDGLQLPAGTNRIRIEFAGLGYVMPQRIRYRYLLEGFDQTWVERGGRADAELTNLPPGQYRFRVSAAYGDGHWSTEEARWSFAVIPAWWQRGPLQLAALLTAMALVVLALRLRTRQLRLSSQRLQQLVERRTADLKRQTERLLALDVERNTLLDRLREQSEAFERQAREDTLTGLPNRRAFEEALSESLVAAREAGRALSLILVDLDHFKEVNDRHSHAVGDATLRAAADALRAAARPGAGLSRWGGEEFAVLLPDCGLDAAREEAEKLRVAIAAIDGERLAPGLRLTASLGVAQDRGGEAGERLLARADAALYRAKQLGRNRVCSEPG